MSVTLPTTISRRKSGKPALPPGETDPTMINAYKTPKQVLLVIIKAGIAKAQLRWWEQALLGFMAGMYVGVGGTFAVMVAGGTMGPDGIGKTNIGLEKLLLGSVFPIALFLIVAMGADLFTGNTMYMVTALLEKKVKWQDLVRVWFISYFSNFLGAACCAYFLVYLPQLTAGEPWNSFIKHLAEAKINQGWGALLLKGIGCNWMVCAALYFGNGAVDMTGKIIGLWWPIAAFAAIGWEHCIANMYFIPLGLMEGAESNFGWFIAKNLIPVTIGNIIGGAVLVGVVQWVAYSSYFGPAVQNMQVVPGNKREYTNDIPPAISTATAKAEVLPMYVAPAGNSNDRPLLSTRTPGPTDEISGGQLQLHANPAACFVYGAGAAALPPPVAHTVNGRSAAPGSAQHVQFVSTSHVGASDSPYRHSVASPVASVTAAELAMYAANDLPTPPAGSVTSPAPQPSTVDLRGSSQGLGTGAGAYQHQHSPAVTGKYEALLSSSQPSEANAEAESETVSHSPTPRGNKASYDQFDAALAQAV